MDVSATQVTPGPCDDQALRPDLVSNTIDVEDDGYILGKDTLCAIGIDADRQLYQLAVTPNDNDRDKISFDDGVTPFNCTNTACESAASDTGIVAIEKLVNLAMENGFPSDKSDELRQVMHKYDGWRLDISADPPARVELLLIRLKQNGKPRHWKPRMYPDQIRKFIADFYEKLEHLNGITTADGLVQLSGTQVFCCIISAPDCGLLTCECHTDSMVAIMPILSLILENANGNEHFALCDCFKGFSQMPLSELCREWLSHRRRNAVLQALPTRFSICEDDAPGILSFV